MPPTGSTFTDWQQEERESRLLIDEDFSWSEPPRRRRRSVAGGPIRASRTAVLEYERESVVASDPLSRRESQHESLDEGGDWNQPTEVHSHFDEMMEQWNTAYGDGAGRVADNSIGRAFDLSAPGTSQAPAQGTRRTVVITGRGDERYLPAPRRRRSSELRFHERAGFSPDRAGLWALLLGIALVVGSIVH